MIDLLDLDPFVDQLKLQCPLFGQRFFATIPGANLEIDQHETPTGFIYIPDDNSEPVRHSRSTYIAQKMNITIAVETVLRRTASRSDLYNSDAVAKIRLYRMEVLTALLGWRPTTARIMVLQHSSGTLQNGEEKVIKFIDTFTTRQIQLGEH